MIAELQVFERSILLNTKKVSLPADSVTSIESMAAARTVDWLSELNRARDFLKFAAPSAL